MFETILHDFARAQGYSLAELNAAQEAYNRQHRLSHPPGKFDKAKRFTLHERGACCDTIRAPSRALPYTEMTHGRSVTHVAQVRGVRKQHVQRLVKAWKKAATHEPLSSHERIQLLVTLGSILKPVRQERSRPAA
ncbi:MAG: hypothetical protein WEB56_16215 [Roseovarius sp.]